jgi:hypothetical protein
MWWLVRLIKIAAVSREMVLNFVAEHSLGLPKSYLVVPVAADMSGWRMWRPGATPCHRL